MKERVLLGMSGGTDSSVAALLLQDAGYEVTGITFRFYEHLEQTGYLDEARALAFRLGIRHITYDAREMFRKEVMDYFVREYMAGHTPVPCTLCNNRLKWPLLRDVADQEGIRYLATGHYVRKCFDNGYYYITTGADPDKDQSFFLWGLKQDILERMLLPMGGRVKTDMRLLAEARGFRELAVKRDSLGVCFCPGDYRAFLRTQPEAESIRPGLFYDEEGNVLGSHEGYPFYTIGQRRGLGIHLNRAVFVKSIDPFLNRVVLAPLTSLERDEMLLGDWNLVCDDDVLGRDDVEVKIRYRKQLNHASVSLRSDGLLHVRLHEPLTAIAVGQAAAFYRGDRLLGGGIIVE